MTDKTRIYISGGITGTTDYMERFQKVEDALKLQGYETVNPSTILSLLPTSTTHSEYMHISYALLDICDGVYMMDRWGDSVGAKLEHEYAIDKGKIVLYE